MQQPQSLAMTPWSVERCRARALGIAPGILAPGPLNALTDVAGVRVGHVTLNEGEAIRTGVTAILPHGGNLYQDRVPAGVPVGKLLGRYYLRDAVEAGDASGSIMIIVATDAPLSDRNLARLARRGLAGLARTGAAFADGSGDYALAFSTAESVRRTPSRRSGLASFAELPNALLSPLFEAAIEATEEAICNALCMATTVTGSGGLTVEALPLERVAELVAAYG